MKKQKENQNKKLSLIDFETQLKNAIIEGNEKDNKRKNKLKKNKGKK